MLNLPSLTSDPFLHICNNLELKDLQALSSISKNCYELTGYSFIWIKFCNQSELKINELAPRFLFLQALNSLNSKAFFACALHFIENKQKSIAHKYLNMTLQTISEENAFKASVQLKKAAFYMACGDIQNPEILPLLSCVEMNSHATVLDRLEATYRVALTECKSKNQTLSLAEIDQKFKSVYEHEKVSEDLCGRAKYMRAFQLHFVYSSGVLSDNEANQLLIEVTENQAVSENIRLSAQYLRAKMHMLNCILTKSLTDEDVDEIYAKVQQSTLSESWKNLSNYYRAVLRIESRVLTLSFDEVDDLLIKCIQSPHADENTKAKSIILRAKLHSGELLASDPKVYKDLHSLASNENNPKVTPQVWAQAVLHLGNDVLLNKTEIISDETADSLLTLLAKKQILENLPISPSTLAEAFAIRAALFLQERTNKMEADLYFMHLNNLFQKTNISPTVQGLCGSIAARLAIKHSFPNVSDSLIDKILAKVIALADPFVSIEAALLRVRFIRERGLNSLSKEKIDELLLQIIQHRNGPTYLKVLAEELRDQK